MHIRLMPMSRHSMKENLMNARLLVALVTLSACDLSTKTESSREQTEVDRDGLLALRSELVPLMEELQGLDTRSPEAVQVRGAIQNLLEDVVPADQARVFVDALESGGHTPELASLDALDTELRVDVDTAMSEWTNAVLSASAEDLDLRAVMVEANDALDERLPAGLTVAERELVFSLLAVHLAELAPDRVYAELTGLGRAMSWGEGGLVAYEGESAGIEGAPPPFVTASAWTTSSLRWCLESTTDDVTEAEVLFSIARAAGAWDRWSGLTMRHDCADPDITLSFTEAPDTFGSPYGVLAHAWFPESGVVEFDDAEDWAVDYQPWTSQPIDLETVGLHELGHALGIDHSAETEAVMYPYYGASRRSLDQDDIDGVQSLYGAVQSPCFEAVFDSYVATVMAASAEGIASTEGLTASQPAHAMAREYASLAFESNVEGFFGGSSASVAGAIYGQLAFVSSEQAGLDSAGEDAQSGAVLPSLHAAERLHPAALAAALCWAQ